MKRIHIFVSGRVQGVYFRAFTKQCADDLSVRGWVRNLSDGRVEAFGIGDDEMIDCFIAKLRKGPTISRVDSVDVCEGSGDEVMEEFDDFRILY